MSRRNGEIDVCRARRPFRACRHGHGRPQSQWAALPDAQRHDHRVAVQRLSEAGPLRVCNVELEREERGLHCLWDAKAGGELATTPSAVGLQGRVYCTQGFIETAAPGNHVVGAEPWWLRRRAVQAPARAHAPCQQADHARASSSACWYHQACTGRGVHIALYQAASFARTPSTIRRPIRCTWCPRHRGHGCQGDVGKRTSAESTCVPF